MDRLTKEVYRKIYGDLVNALKADFGRLLSHEQIEFVEQNWRRRLEESKIFLSDAESPAFAAIRLINQNISFVRPPALASAAAAAPPAAPAPAPRPRAEEPRRAAEGLPAIREEPERPTRRIEIKLNLQREEERSAAADSSADDDGLFGEARPAPPAERTPERAVEEERGRLLMFQRVEEAIGRKDEEELNREQEDDAEEPLNSEDDVQGSLRRVPAGAPRREEPPPRLLRQGRAQEGQAQAELQVLRAAHRQPRGAAALREGRLPLGGEPPRPALNARPGAALKSDKAQRVTSSPSCAGRTRARRPRAGSRPRGRTGPGARRCRPAARFWAAGPGS